MSDHKPRLLCCDVNIATMEVRITRAYVRSRFGDCKTEASKKPVPLNRVVWDALLVWRKVSPFPEDGDFLFASVRLNGAKPLSPDSLCKKSIKPAVARAGIQKQIGWHSLRHSLATWLQASGADIKTTQDLMRHTTARMTMDTYAKGVDSSKRVANGKVVEMMLSRPKVAV